MTSTHGRFTTAISLVSISGATSIPARLLASARAAEEAGFEALFLPDHYVQNRIGGGPAAPMLDAYTALGAIAARTDRIGLGALVSSVTFRNPAQLAKAVSTLDALSAGRALMGVGAGWDIDEHVAYGVEFPGVRERIDRLGEMLEITRLMFSDSPASYAGRYYRIAAAYLSPGPSRGSIPVLIGASGRRMLGLVARFGDIWNTAGADVETVRRRLSDLHDACGEVQRDPGSIWKTVFLPPSQCRDEQVQAVVGPLLEAGIDGVIIGDDCSDASSLGERARKLRSLWG